MPKKRSIFEGRIEKEGITPSKDEFLESEEHEEPHEELELEMHTGKRETDVYTEEGREELMEDDEISPAEEGFAKGAEGKGSYAKCAHCGKILVSNQKSIIREINNKQEVFCSDNCAKDCIAKHKTR